MNKKTVLFLSLIAFAVTLSNQLNTQQPNHKEFLSKTKQAFEQETEQVKKSVNEAKEVITKKLKKQKESFFSKVKSFITFQNIDFSKLPILYILLMAFIIGIITSFTPCIYPMIPITIGILQSQASPSISRNFLLSTTYVAGMATVYAMLGYFAATTAMIFGQWLANPWLIGFLILFFLYLAGSMFGFYEIWMPQFTKKQASIKKKGSVLYTFLFGAISGTAASPCLTPALIGLLGFVTKIGSPLIGFFTLFVFAFGLGILLIIVGTFSTSITTLPRAGTWMNEIKKIFGFLMILITIYFLNPFISSSISMFLYFSLLVVTIGYYAFVIAKVFLKKK